MIMLISNIICQQKPITTFLRELQLVDDDDIVLKMIPESVLCQNYVDLRVELRRYTQVWSIFYKTSKQVSLFIIGTLITTVMQ